MFEAKGIKVASDLLNVSVIKPDELSVAEREAWKVIRQQNLSLYSPYFHPDYTRLVGELREDAFVAVIRDGNDYIGFFPFQGPKGQGGFARPIGAPMTDYHGFIMDPSRSDIDYVEVLSRAGIGAYHYSALVDPVGQLSQYNNQECEGVVINLSSGVESWRAERDSSYRRHIKSNRRRIRKAEEDIGPRRFEFKSKDRAVFDQLIRWKQEKFSESGKYDVLSAGWTLEMLERLWDSQDDLRGDMQVLYFGERLAAIDFGLSDGETFHSWMVAYDADLHTYAPGIQLLEGLIDAAQLEGYNRIDLGTGTEGYKRHYATEPVTVGSGFVAVSGPAAALSQIYGATEKWGQKALGDAPGKLRRRYSQIAACDDTFSGRAKAMIDAVRSSQK